jgi:hypothetical protein
MNEGEVPQYYVENQIKELFQPRFLQWFNLKLKNVQKVKIGTAALEFSAVK